jgi:hypothetical protein
MSIQDESKAGERYKSDDTSFIDSIGLEEFKRNPYAATHNCTQAYCAAAQSYAGAHNRGFALVLVGAASYLTDPFPLQCGL